MKMSELILAVGDENVRFNNLFDCLKSVSTNKKGITTISFMTDGVTATELMAPGKTKNIALVLWLPRDKVEAAIATGKVLFPAV